MLEKAKFKKMPYSGRKKWRDLLWCSVVCRNSFLAANQPFWSAELIRWSRLWTFASWFVQLSSNGVCLWGVTKVLLGSRERCLAWSHMSQGGCTGMSIAGSPCPSQGCGRACLVLLVLVCHKKKCRCGVWSFTAYTKLVKVVLKHQLPFSGTWFRCTNKVDKTCQPLLLHHLLSAGPA